MAAGVTATAAPAAQRRAAAAPGDAPRLSEPTPARVMSIRARLAEREKVLPPTALELIREDILQHYFDGGYTVSGAAKLIRLWGFVEGPAVSVIQQLEEFPAPMEPLEVQWTERVVTCCVCHNCTVQRFPLVETWGFPATHHDVLFNMVTAYVQPE